MLQIRALGPLEAGTKGTAVPLGAPRQRAVLARLLVARGAVVSVDRLAEDLWRGTPPAKALVSLHTYVSNLRRLLEPERPPRAPACLLVTSVPGYALRLPGEAVDAWHFEGLLEQARKVPAPQARELLADALACWRGPAFQEHADEDWAAPEAARLTGLLADARELAAAADLRTGSPAEAARAAADLVAAQPLREEGWRLLALAHWACGRQADALTALRRAGAVIREELGCDPSPVLGSVERAILEQRLDVLRAETSTAPGTSVPSSASGPVALNGAHAGGAQAPTPGADAGRPGADTGRPGADTGRPGADTGRPGADAGRPGADAGRLFLGREEELRTAEAAARAARAGGGVMLVTGEAGAGKSAFLSRLADRLASDGWTVVVGRCPAHEGAPPAWAWVEALGALARRAEPAAPAELAVLLHEPAAAPAATRDEATAGRFRMHRAFTAWLSAAAAERPLAVLLEDLHRADAETLALLEAAGAAVGVPLLTVACYRPSEVGDRLAKTLAQLAPRPPHRIALGGLPADAVATVVTTVCGTAVAPATLAAIAARTGGNPFYVWESARLLAGEGELVALSEVPQGVRDVLRRRLALLPDAALAAMRLVSVMGAEADVALLVEAADAEEETVLAGLDAALAADLLTEPGPGRVGFVHALVRDTVYTGLTGVRRARLHDRVAAVLRRHRPDDLAALAHHFARSGRTANAPLAVDYALRAAELAERRYAHDVAVGLLTQAIDVHAAAATDPHAAPDATVGLLVRLLGAQIRAGATDAARHTRRRAVELAVRARRDDLVAAVYGAWTEPSPWRSRLEGLFDRTALARLERLAGDRSLDEETRARVLQVLADAVAGEDATRARAAADAQLALARASGEPKLLAAALMTSARLLPLEHHARERDPLVARLRLLACEHDLPAYRWVCEHLDAMTAASRNDPAGVNRHTSEGLHLADRYEMLWARGINATTQAMLAAITGRFTEAEERYAQADELFSRVGAHHANGPRTLGLWTIRFTQGRTADIERSIREVHEAVGAPVAVAHALVLARQGRLDEARAISLPTAPVTDHLYGIELDYRSELAVLCGDLSAAGLLVRHLLPLRDQFGGAAGAAYASRPLAHPLGDLYRLLGEEAAAAEAYARAERVALAWHAPHHAAAARRAAAELATSLGRHRTFAF
ncbi:BTAD domain-containing putative transcriptional regulator [Streptomyces racemochromogenes]|uniref:BTAD domain-containing putative transcriptional regulator n=1 Tax=Streptomyces racemochromogenes TaxID=67353 RepID=A0ABW7P912_9ACTN